MCYQNCLRAACEAKLTSIAFCCISTGVFGSCPSDAAAFCAVHTVLQWLEAEAELASCLQTVIFCVYNAEDDNAYRLVLSQMSASQRGQVQQQGARENADGHPAAASSCDPSEQSSSTDPTQ